MGTRHSSHYYYNYNYNYISVAFETHVTLVDVTHIDLTSTSTEKGNKILSKQLLVSEPIRIIKRVEIKPTVASLNVAMQQRSSTSSSDI